MARALSHSILIVAILACPFWCRLKACSCAEQEPQAVSASCPHCDGQRTNGDSSPEQQPTQPDGQKCDHCQCICGGAIAHDSGQYDSVLELVPSLHDGTATLAVVTAADLDDLQAQIDQPVIGGDQSPGRAIRCRLMSFLC